MTMINFSCTNIPVFEVLQCSFNLNKTELRILSSLDGEVTTQDISDDLDVSKSLAQRSMKSLYDKDVVERRQVNRRDGGYTYVYQRKPRDELVERVQRIIADWSERAQKAIEDEAFTDGEATPTKEQGLVKA